MISFIIPAHNEEACLGWCISAIRDAVRVTDQEYEIVVVDDSSNDETSTVALLHGASVVLIDCRHIAASRNAGARAARGDVFFFVNADTLLADRTVESALR